MRITIAEVGKTRTRYYHGGTGPGVFLVHGVGMSSDTWFPALPQLARRFSVCAPDLLDNGFTEPGPYRGGPPQPHMVTHLLALADHLGHARFSIVGSSLGALLAVLVALRAPQRVDKLVLVGPGATLERPEALAAVLQAAQRNGRTALDDPSYESCRVRMGRAVFDVRSVPDALIVMQMCLYALPGAADKFERRMAGLLTAESLAEHTIYSALERVRAPTLAIVGREDPRGNYADTIANARRMPNATVLSYEKCGHWPHVEHPQRFAEDVASFLQ
jgi:pimeloyl-ACP methyl ester carboxylesterase